MRPRPAQRNGESEVLGPSLYSAYGISVPLAPGPTICVKRRAAPETSHGHDFVSRAKGEKGVVLPAGLPCQSLGETAEYNGPVGEPAGETCVGLLASFVVLMCSTTHGWTPLSDAQHRAQRPRVRCMLGRCSAQQSGELSCNPQRSSFGP